jgi:hypothetical protein
LTFSLTPSASLVRLGTHIWPTQIIWLNTHISVYRLLARPGMWTSAAAVHHHQLVRTMYVGGYIETKHPTWHDSFKLPALKGKSMTRKYIEVGYT